MLDFVQKMNQLGRAQVPFLFILDFDLKYPIVLPLNTINSKDISFSFGNKSNEEQQNFPPKDLIFNFTAPPQEEFEIAFQKIQKELHAGNSYLTNLCFRSPISCNWNLETVFQQASAKYKLRYKDEFVFFSPETFVKIENGIISTFPMKGTIDASLPNAHNILLQDPKEEAEHATIVDLLRNDLSRIAKKVRLKKYKYLDLIKTNKGNIWQMSSEIEGVLPKNYASKIGNIINALLPAGSISGAPKRKTVEIINKVEKGERSYYTGVSGVFDGKNLDSGVMIRFIEKKNNKLFYRSGGGITAKSVCKKEYQELQQKIYIPINNSKSLLVETIRLKNGIFENLQWHEERMNRSRLLVFGQKNRIDLPERLSCNYGFGEQLVMCRLVYDKKIKQIEFIPYREKDVRTLQLVKLPKTATEETAYKWAHRVLYQKLLAKKGDADDVLIVRDGKITDTSICNVAFWDGQQWWTPKNPLLKGTTRARLLEEELILEKIIKLEDLDNYKKIRLFNAMIPWASKKELSVSNILRYNKFHKK